ncbi:hypothetical protein CH275_26825 [Rhodococcus sp. 06-235-1A]|uniref:hypothetical protein n=1 Tax=Rhodococcus sp. 06-235-1A TaxID=2022508 RepID=UPI000B9AC396|nr:hypothetical protein [Rhodococcus sp. 06-235-1A]OZC96156.1 hypothetical protein CH275_26825 [Rhodococcus sp. 06-235-1A]
MGFPRIARQGKAAGDPPGPFDQGGRRLRIVVDVAPDHRRLEEWNGNTYAPLNMPDPEIFLWSLTEGESIDRYWIGTADDPADAGRVVIPPGPLDPSAHDYLGFSTIEGQGRWTERAIWPYSTYETFAQEDAGAHAGLSAEQWLAELLVARASNEMRADLLATINPRLLSSQAAYVTETNPLSAVQAVGVVGLYLRSKGQYPVVGPERLVLDERSMFLLAVEELLPSWRVWASELSRHTYATDNDTPALLAQSVRERIIRMLRCRDQLLIASMASQTNTTMDRLVESLDYFLVNLVGAFDAAARAAHLVYDLPKDKTRTAGWQNEKWLKKLRNADLEDLFAPDSTGYRLFEICRFLRNTVHGEGLPAIALNESRVAHTQTFVRLPRNEADVLVDHFDQLGGQDAWGLRRFGDGLGDYIDAATFVERLIPSAMGVLDEAIKNTPTSRLTGIGQFTIEPPVDHARDSPGTRARVMFLLGLPKT